MGYGECSSCNLLGRHTETALVRGQLQSHDRSRPEAVHCSFGLTLRRAVLSMVQFCPPDEEPRYTKRLHLEARRAQRHARHLVSGNSVGGVLTCRARISSLPRGNLNISQQSADDLSGPRAVTSVSRRSCGVQIDQLFGHKDFLLFGEIHRHELFGRDSLPLCPLHIPRASVRIMRVFVGKFSLRF
jgi:hypothetical protein